MKIPCAVCGWPHEILGRKIGKQFFCGLACELWAERQGLHFTAAHCLNCGKEFVTQGDRICKRCRKNGKHHIRVNHQAALLGGQCSI